MDKFVEETFRKAVEDAGEADDAARAWSDSAVPALLAARESVGGENFAPLVKAVRDLGLENTVFGILQVFFFAGFSCGRESR